MDKNTLSHYGWIVVLILILSVMLAFATPFGGYIKLATENVLFGMIDTGDNALSTGLNGILNGDNNNDNDGDNTTIVIPDDALILNEGDLIPVDGIYIQGYYDEQTGSYVETNYLVGNGIDVYFPTLQSGDIFAYDNYIYEYLDGSKIHYESHTEPLDGWSVYVDDVSMPISDSIYTKINGKYTKEMAYTFANAVDLVVSPKIPATVEYMDGAYYGCESLTSMPELPKGVKDITTAFNGCISLTNTTTIPDSVTKMEEAFAWCYSLETAPNIPKNVTNVRATFAECTSLKGDIIVNSDKLTNESASGFLSGTQNDIYIGGNCSESTKQMLCELKDDYTGTECVHYYSDYVIPTGGIYTIDENHDPIIGDGTKTFVFPLKPRTSFDYGDFIYYYDVTLVPAHGVVTVYANDAEHLEYWAVVTKEEKATYGKMLDEIAGKDVADLTGLLYHNQIITTMPYLSKNALIIDEICAEATSFTNAGVLPNKIISMRYAFSEATSLKTPPAIPTSVKDMYGAFYKCSSLETFPVIPENVEDLSYAFALCTAIKGDLIVNTNKINEYYNVSNALASINGDNITISGSARQEIKDWLLLSINPK